MRLEVALKKVGKRAIALPRKDDGVAVTLKKLCPLTSGCLWTAYGTEPDPSARPTNKERRP
jgi:hypothetical protein